MAKNLFVLALCNQIYNYRSRQSNESLKPIAAVKIAVAFDNAMTWAVQEHGKIITKAMLEGVYAKPQPRDYKSREEFYAAEKKRSAWQKKITDAALKTALEEFECWAIEYYKKHYGDSIGLGIMTAEGYRGEQTWGDEVEFSRHLRLWWKKNPQRALFDGGYRLEVDDYL